MKKEQLLFNLLYFFHFLYPVQKSQTSRLDIQCNAGRNI